MEQVIRHEFIEGVETRIVEARLVMVTAPAAGGGVTTALRQWSTATRHPVEFGTCPDLSPQRPLAAFEAGEVPTLVGAGEWAEAANRLGQRHPDADEATVVVIDDADRIDEASAHLTNVLLEAGGRVVLGHHHSASTNPSLQEVIDGVRPEDRASLVVAPMTETDVAAALDDVDVADASIATGGNPLALSLYGGSGFVSVSTSVLERFDRLPADGQGLMAVIAASPEPIEFRILEAMGRPWDDHGRHLAKTGLVTVHDATISLRHDKIRRVLYEEMTAVRRRFVHAEILRFVADTSDPSVVMHHAVGAGDVETIIAAGPRAADEAAGLGAYREAARHLENVLAYEHSIPESDRSTLRAALDAYLAAR